MKMDKNAIAVLIDADNISAQIADYIFQKVCAIGEPIVRRAYGMVNSFSLAGGWTRAQRDYGIVACPQVSNVSGKNVADIALVIDAMEFLYNSPCQGICIVSSDSDFTALASKIRECGKFAYGLGGAKTPVSFRMACTEFFELPAVRRPGEKKQSDMSTMCPRCGGKLESAWTKSNKPCKTCPACGGVAVKLSTLRNMFSEESVGAMLESAKAHMQAGCQCPDCGGSMSLLKVAAGKRNVEIDVCGKCQTVWYDKGEFELLLPDDGALVATVSAGKAYRRGIVMALAADLRSGRRKVPDVGNLKSVLKKVYHMPSPDVEPVVSTLMSQRVIQIDKKSGRITVCKLRE